MGPFFCTKNEKIDFEEKINSMEGLVNVPFFNIKRPINIESPM